MSTTKDATQVPAAVKTKSKKTEKSDEDALFDGFLTEVEDDLREEELKKLWAKYGTYVIGAAVSLILGVFGWQLWRQDVENQRIEVAKQYEAASKLLQDGKLDEALTTYAVVAAEKGQGYAALAQLQKAAIALEKNDREGALAAYKSLGEDAAADPLFRDLGVLLRALHGVDSENPLELEASLAPLRDPANPFSFSATELTALLAQKQGDTARALQLVEGLIADAETPQGIRQRAQELSAVFKGGATVAPLPATETPAPGAPAPATNQ